MIQKLISLFLIYFGFALGFMIFHGLLGFSFHKNIKDSLFSIL